MNVARVASETFCRNSGIGLTIVRAGLINLEVGVVIVDRDRRMGLREIIVLRSGTFRQMTVPVYSSGVVDVWRKGATWGEQEEAGVIVVGGDG